MLQFLPAPIIFCVATLLLTLNIVFWCSILFVAALLRLLLPPLLPLFERLMIIIADSWIYSNGLWMQLTQDMQWDIAGVDQLQYRGWYLVTSNHQSWVDILVLQRVFWHKIPFLKFFLKKELMYVPVMGLAWWALDFPFMQRFSKDYLKKHPEKKGQDFETTRRACQKFSRMPTSVMNFLEGTRFTPAKHKRQHSPYRYLLKPKSGGIALAINSLGDKFQSLVNVTIVYPDGIPTFVDFLCGRVKRVTVRVDEIEIPPALHHGDYDADPAFRSHFHQWVHELWLAKDAKIAALLHPEANAPDVAAKPERQSIPA